MDPRVSDPELAARLEAAIPHPPTHVDLTVAAAAGRRAVRRRRVATAAGGLLVAGVVGSGLVLSQTTGPAADRSGTVASSPTSQGDVATSAPEPEVQVVVGTGEAPTRVDPQAQAPELDVDGVLVLPPGTEVLQSVVEPLGLASPARSVAVAYRSSGVPDERWALLSVRPGWRTDGGSKVGLEEDGRAAYDQPADTLQGQSFGEWVRAQAQFGVGPQQWPELGLPSEPYLRLDGSLVLPDGARAVAQVSNPLGAAAPATSLALAWVPAGERDARWTVLFMDPTWTAARPTGRGLVNGFGALTRPAVAGQSLEAWADEVGRGGVAGFVPDAPPAWVATSHR